MLDPDIAQALGVTRTASIEEAASRVISTAFGRYDNDRDIPKPVAQYLMTLVEELAPTLWDGKVSGDTAALAARASVGNARRFDAPAILAYLDPHQRIPAMTVGELPKHCRALLLGTGERIAVKLLAQWVDYGLTRAA